MSALSEGQSHNEGNWLEEVLISTLEEKGNPHTESNNNPVVCFDGALCIYSFPPEVVTLLCLYVLDWSVVF